jgi:MFS family permease
MIYFVSLALMSAKGFDAGTRTRAGSLVDDVLVGWRFLQQVPLLLILVVVTLLFSLTYGPLEPALPVLVHDIFHEGARALGFLWSAFALGALAGTLLWARTRPRWTLRIVVAAIVALWGLFSGALSIAPNFWVSALLLALGGFSYAPYNILFSVWRQRLVPDELRGRVFGAINSVTGVGLPLGQALGGVLLALVGVHWTLAIGGIACMILGVACYAGRQFWQETNRLDAEVS